MKKILLGLAVLAFSAIPTIAQNNEDSGKTTCPENTVCAAAQNCPDPGVCVKCPGKDKCKDCKDCKGCLEGKVCESCVKGTKVAAIGWGRGKCPGFSAFEGLNLSESQKTQLQQLCKDWQVNTENQKKSRKNNDSLSKEQIQKNREECRAKCVENKKKCLEDVKKILTPEQYTQFLEKCYTDNRGKHFKHGGKHGHKSHGHQCKGVKGQKK